MIISSAQRLGLPAPSMTEAGREFIDACMQNQKLVMYVMFFVFFTMAMPCGWMQAFFIDLVVFALVHYREDWAKLLQQYLEDLKELIAYGGSPRATICLAKTARAHAFLQRRGFVTPDDVRAMGMDVLRHRVLVTYEAEAEEVTPEDVVQRILDRVEVP